MFVESPARVQGYPDQQFAGYGLIATVTATAGLRERSAD